MAAANVEQAMLLRGEQESASSCSEPELAPTARLAARSPEPQPAKQKARNLLAIPALLAAGFACTALRWRWAAPGSRLSQELADAASADSLSAQGGLPGAGEPEEPGEGPERSLQLLTDLQQEEGPMTMTFYMYHAQQGGAKHLENANAGDLAGVMWYLHSKVVGAAPRKRGMDRIQRYKVVVRSTDFHHSQRHQQFGPYVNFSDGRCVARNCDSIWNQYGFNVGCEVKNSSGNVYRSPFVTHLRGPSCPQNCREGVWYSLPGPCPAMSNAGKTLDCNLRMPGGMCNDITLVGKQSASCTYYAEKAGEVYLNELTGITNYTHFWKVEGKKEYDEYQDRGVGADFWDNRGDPQACIARMRKVHTLFVQKFPELPATYGEPPCDAE